MTIFIAADSLCTLCYLMSFDFDNETDGSVMLIEDVGKAYSTLVFDRLWVP